MHACQVSKRLSGPAGVMKLPPIEELSHAAFETLQCMPTTVACSDPNPASQQVYRQLFPMAGWGHMAHLSIWA